MHKHTRCSCHAHLQLATPRHITFTDDGAPAAQPTGSSPQSSCTEAGVPRTPAVRDSAMLEVVKAAQYKSLVEHR